MQIAFIEVIDARNWYTHTISRKKLKKRSPRGHPAKTQGKSSLKSAWQGTSLQRDTNAAKNATATSAAQNVLGVDQGRPCIPEEVAEEACAFRALITAHHAPANAIAPVVLRCNVS